MTSDYDPYFDPGPQQRPGDPGAGSGRRRRAPEPGGADPGQGHPGHQDVGGQDQGYQEQHNDRSGRHGHGGHAQPSYPGFGAYPDQHGGPGPYPEQYPDAIPPDPQWENSGLGWDQREWNEAQRVDTPFDPRRELSHQSWPETERRRENPADFADPAGFPPYEDYPEADRSDRSDRPQHPEARRGVGFDEIDGMARRPSAAQIDESAEPTRYAEPYRESEPYRETEPFSETEPFRETGPFREEPFGEPVVSGEQTVPPEPKASAAGIAFASKGAGAFGAAGIAVLIGITAIASNKGLAIVVGLSQIGLAIGWARTAGLEKDRRTVALIALIGLGATAVAYRIQSGPAVGDAGSVLGAGFVVLAADQLFRRDPGRTRHKSEVLATAVAGAAFAVLPAGYLVAQHQDSKLAGSSALAAAVAVLCTALIGGGSRPMGDVAGVVAAAMVGTLGAISLSSPAGAKGGAIAGVAAGLFGLAASRVATRLGDEGSDIRIIAQVLPAAFAGTAAAIAALALR